MYWIAIRIQTQFCFENCKFLLYAWRHSANSMLSVVCVSFILQLTKSEVYKNNRRKLKPMNIITHAYHTRKLFQLVRTLFDSAKKSMWRSSGVTCCEALWNNCTNSFPSLICRIHYHIGQMMNLISKIICTMRLDSIAMCPHSHNFN